ncbi:MAG: ABC-F family ATP-binding cassette domain-containing protein [Clostridia bacterium]|nr:ABC-F family ATP-binding cassette domain-containing protein [Clostridia bacterium]
MVILTADKISKSFGGEELFADVTFEIKDNDKIGLIGPNGAGKTTLFKILTGQYEADSGAVVRRSGLRVGYMRQMVAASGSVSGYEETLSVFSDLIEIENRLHALTVRLETDHSTELINEHSALQEKFHLLGGLTFRSRTRSALIGLGITDDQMKLPLTSLSGGQLSKISLAKLLLSPSDVLLLDEPTNHLDTASCEWLEEFLRGYKGALVIVSHDRYFLDAVTNRTFEIEGGRVFIANGGYTEYMKLKEKRLESELHEYENTLKEIERIEGIITQQHQWNREKNIKTAESKQKQVDRLRATLRKPIIENSEIHFKFSPQGITGNEVLHINGATKSYGDRLLYENVRLDIMRGERVFLLGSNGCGKTTLMKEIMNGTSVRFGAGVKCGYFDQTQRTLHDEKTALDEIWDENRGMTRTEIQNALALFRFRGDDVFKKVGDLSGGERAKLSILKLMLSSANFLLLDEPTNHLDIYSRQALEDALIAFGGTMLIVSHDRRFINRLGDKIWSMENGTVTEYIGNYDYYLEKKAPPPEQQRVQKTVGSGGLGYKEKKEQQSRIRRLKTAVATFENEIAELEGESELLNAQLVTDEVSADYKKTMEITARLAEIEGLLENKMTEWAELNEQLESVQNSI